MIVLLLGSGGREHALARALKADPSVTRLLVAPGNPGTEELGDNVAIDANDPQQVLELAQREHADLVVVGPEAPLVAGVADVLREAGIAVFGPNQAAAQLEGSKAFAKEIMAAAEVATADAATCTDEAAVQAALDKFGAPYVVKADGLAAGKGVVVTSDRDAAVEHALACLEGGGQVLIEEYLDGPEVSLFCLSDGQTVVPLQPAQDFKRIYDQGEGPNTGGMGAYSPLPWIPADLPAQVVQSVAQPVVTELAKREMPFVGLLYCGLALTSNGVRVVEFNARFGDPETQVVLSLLKSPLAQVLDACARGKLADFGPLEWEPGASVTVVISAAGYPGTPTKGDPITGLDAAHAIPGVHVIHAGTALDEEGQLVSNGGRVLSVTAVGEDLAQARERAYQAVEQIHLAGSHHRTDIAAEAVGQN
ncbi:phosphoribosylamine--glycine ligase [Boudabousia liubingyangii]|uniref:Phosphoribosylamine--glycine ligase n=1 Tax=Boudabousia liubingyangii TaxID=1921764 RepID=A0A1Q5PK43_9ACTO|nr:phosphoribosylamine--glycine ligase [Boudabousia liubingyangii]OKL46595.1 phosphoribosylamine--glycine ligase [Boudabousia liubingyangii]OKL46819.1 phosphoribosylamine--glycine ligase [Boudabousia liubingyangii]